MNAEELATATKAFLVDDYPDISVQVLDADSSRSRRRVSFRSAKFTDLYPLQRYHYIVHHFPADFYREHLSDTEWYELAPGESEQDLVYPDEQLIRDITDDVTRCLVGSGFFRRLDDSMCPADDSQTPHPCHGDFRHAKAALAASGFNPEEYFDVLHVLMAEGGYCDCEILYNTAPDNRLKARYWSKRAKHQ
jgi:hypothetical protein